ncbi:MAG: holo-ACP synthase, partial [Dehalococcoidia bacterium]
VYTPLEIAFCRGRVSELAARFAAKEAVMKALGTGVRGVSWREIEVLPNPRGKPLVSLSGHAARRAELIGLHQIDISLSHTRAYAVASVVGETTRMSEAERMPRIRGGSRQSAVGSRPSADSSLMSGYAPPNPANESSRIGDVQGSAVNETCHC